MDLLPVGQVTRDRSVNLLKAERGILLADRFGRVALLEGVHDRIERNARVADSKSARRTRENVSSRVDHAIPLAHFSGSGYVNFRCGSSSRAYSASWLPRYDTSNSSRFTPAFNSTSTAAWSG